MPTEVVQTAVARKDGWDLAIGKFVVYEVTGIPFAILVSRMGVQLQGVTPPLTADGVDAFRGLMARARVHHQHFAATPVGQPQTVLDEAQVELILGEVHGTDTDHTRTDAGVPPAAGGPVADVPGTGPVDPAGRRASRVLLLR